MEKGGQQCLEYSDLGLSKSMERVDAGGVSQLMAFGGMVDCAWCLEYIIPRESKGYLTNTMF